MLTVIARSALFTNTVIAVSCRQWRSVRRSNLCKIGSLRNSIVFEIASLEYARNDDWSGIVGLQASTAKDACNDYLR